jgi:hypothetical protein
MATLNPRSFNILPVDAAVTPLPTELTTPPVKKIYLVPAIQTSKIQQRKKGRAFHPVLPFLFQSIGVDD